MGDLRWNDDTRREAHFWGNVKYPSNDAAKAARDLHAREWKAAGWTVRRSVLRDQMREYESFGVPDGRSGHVYIVTGTRSENGSGR